MTMRRNDSLAPKFDETSTFEAFEAEEITSVRARTLPVTSEEVRPYLYLVHEVVGRMLRRLPPSVQRDDLFGAGCFGLLDALRRHGENRGVEFEWYARVRIRGAALDELRSQDWLSRGQRAQVTRAASEGTQRPGGVVIRFDDLHDGANAPRTEATPFDVAASASERRALRAAVARLPAREGQIVEMHFFRGMQFKEIAAEMKVSEARVSQLRARAMGKLRGILAENEPPAA